MRTERLIAIIAAALCCAGLSAQTFDRTLRRNLWNDGANANGIRLDSLDVSYAEAYGRYAAGDFRHSYDASTEWSAGAEAASIMHLDRFSMAGRFGFAQTSGKDMCGSMFIHPGCYPIDAIEFTPGDKTLQTYSFEGGIAVDISSEWRIGGRLAFESSNYSKRKDVRHTNYRLDIALTPAIQWHRGPWTAGAHLLVAKDAETISAEQIGSNVAAYYAFLDKGLGFGRYEIWNGSGVHLAENGVNGLPVRQMQYGVGAECSYGGFYADIEGRIIYGSSGEKQFVWFRFPGRSLSSNLGWASGRHQARLALSVRHLDNAETVLEKVTKGGVTTVVEHGSNIIRSTTTASVRPDYRYLADRWEVHACGEFARSTDFISIMYPYATGSSLTTAGFSADGTYFLGRWQIGGSLEWTGGWNEEVSRTVDGDSGVSTKPYRLTTIYDTELEYSTRPRYSAGLDARFDIFRGLYAGVSAYAEYADGAKFIAGTLRYGASIRFGYDF